MLAAAPAYHGHHYDLQGARAISAHVQVVQDGGKAAGWVGFTADTDQPWIQIGIYGNGRVYFEYQTRKTGYRLISGETATSADVALVKTGRERWWAVINGKRWLSVRVRLPFTQAYAGDELYEPRGDYRVTDVRVDADYVYRA